MIFSYCPFCQSPLYKTLNKIKCLKHPEFKFTLNFDYGDWHELTAVNVNFYFKGSFYEVWVMDWGSKIYNQDNLYEEIWHHSFEHWDWSDMDAFKAQVQMLLAFS